MAGIRRFEDIHGWQEARKLTGLVYDMTASGLFAHDFGLRDQVRRAAVSVMAYVAEGFDCDSKLEFARFLGIARRSVVEVQSLLYVASDVGYLTEARFKMLMEQAAKTKGLIGALKLSLGKPPVRSEKRQ